jgi:chemotaxis-related protein WspB
MLFLVFELDGDRYALETRQLIEVLPLVNLKPLAKAPPGIAGMFDYHGQPVPAVDLSEVILGRAAQRRLNTRMVIVNYPGADDASHTLGLIAEKATATARMDAAQFSETGVSHGDAPYLGPVARDARGLIQWLTVPQLLPPAVRNVLFKH